MNPLTRNLAFLKKLYSEKACIRTMLEGPNYTFVRDFRPGHFYSPLPDLADVRANAGLIFDGSTATLDSVNLREQEQTELLAKFSLFYSEIPFTDNESKENRYYFDNP